MIWSCNIGDLYDDDDGDDDDDVDEEIGRVSSDFARPPADMFTSSTEADNDADDYDDDYDDDLIII